MLHDIGVVIVNWNTQQCLISCIQSYLTNGVYPEHIVIVDQGSSDGSLELVKTAYPLVKCSSLPQNTGYGSAINYGGQLLNTTFLVASNADVIVPQGVLTVLCQAMLTDQELALLGCKNTDEAGNNRTRFTRTTILRGMLLELLPSFMRGTWRSLEQESHKSVLPQSVRYVEGAFLFLRHTHFDAVGGFDEGLSFFFEDADLPMRLLNTGFDVQFIPSVSIVHLGGESFSQVPVRHKEEYYRNFLRLHKRHALRRALWMQRIYAHCFKWVASLLFIIKNISGNTLSNKINQRWQVLSAIEKIYTPISFTKINAEHPLVSVIIPTYNRPDCLMHLLRKLQHQVYKNYEVIVVDQSDEASDRIGHLRSDLSYPIIFLHSDYPNRSNAKNIGIRNARGEIILFCDDDITPSDEMLEVHVRYHHDPTIGGVSCRIIENDLPPLRSTDICRVTWYGRMKDGFQSDVSCDVGTLIGGNMSMRREILHEIGYFDANYRGTSIFEEQDLSERLKNLGYRIHFTNETTIVHQPQTNGNVNLQNSETAKYYFNFNHNEILYFLKNRNHLLLLFVIPFCILRATKKTIQFHLSVSKGYRILYGIVDGIKTYYRSLKL